MRPPMAPMRMPQGMRQQQPMMPSMGQPPVGNSDDN